MISGVTINEGLAINPSPLARPHPTLLGIGEQDKQMNCLTNNPLLFFLLLTVCLTRQGEQTQSDCNYKALCDEKKKK